MKLYVDQMFRVDFADLLRQQGHEVLRAFEAGQARADDAEILERACREERTLVTLDKHFGDWTVLPLREHFGVIRLKIHPSTTERAATVLLLFLGKHQQEEFRNRLIILSPTTERWIKTAEN